MKKIILVIFIAILLMGCKSKISEAEKWGKIGEIQNQEIVRTDTLILNFIDSSVNPLDTFYLVNDISIGHATMHYSNPVYVRIKIKK